MKKTIILVLGILLLLPSLVSAVNITAGDSISFDLGEKYSYYSLSGNATPIDLNISQNGTIVTIISNKYSLNDIFDIVFYKGEEIISPTSSSTTIGSGCLPSWKCTDWGDCVNGKQTRTCTNLKSYCPSIKPAEEQACIIAITPVTSTIPKIPTEPTIQTAPIVIPKILDAVIGTLKTPIGIIITFVILVALIGITNYIRKTKGKKDDN